MIKVKAPRLNRAESQAQTRKLILDSARQEIVRCGVDAASIRNICEAAGFSQGAFYSNFASKEDLLLEVMEAHMREEAERLERIVALRPDADVEAFLADIGLWLAKVREDRGWATLAIELRLHADRDANFAVAFDRSRAAYLDNFARGLGALYQRLGREPPFDLAIMVVGFDALWRGALLQGGAQAAPADRVMIEFLRVLLSA